MYKNAAFRHLLLFIISLGIFSLFLPSVSFSQIDSSPRKQEVLQVKVENGLLSVELKNANLKRVLQEVGRQANLHIEGLEMAGGEITQKFENLPLEEGLKKISQNLIMILTKSGEKGEILHLKKVIIVAQNNLPEIAQGQKPGTDEKKPGPDSPPLPAAPATTPSTPPESSPQESIRVAAPAPKKPAPSPGEAEKAGTKTTPETAIQSGTDSQLPDKTSDGTQTTEKEPPIDSSLKEKTQRPSETEKSQPPVTPASIAIKTPEKKSSPPAKPIPPSSGTSPDLAKGEKYSQEKRWDQAIKYLRKYVGQNPSDSEGQEKLNTAQQKAEESINLYNQAKGFEGKGDFAAAYEYYKKSYDIYPLLYDTWERMQATKKKAKK